MNKNQFRQKAQDEISDWGAGVDRLKTRVSDAAVEAQHEMHRKIEALEDRIEPAWNSVKVGVKHAADTVRSQDNKTVNAALWAGAGALLVGGLILVWNRSRA